MATNVLGTVYETLLCSPGMNEAVKIEVKINRKTVLFLNSIIESGLSAKGGENKELLELIPDEDKAVLKILGEDCLKKAGLMELNEKIRQLVVK